jgi:hypothetical protein
MGGRRIEGKADVVAFWQERSGAQRRRSVRGGERDRGLRSFGVLENFVNLRDLRAFVINGREISG